MEGVTRIIMGLSIVFVATSAILYTLPNDTNPLDDISWLGFSDEKNNKLLIATHTKITLWDTNNGTLLRSKDLGSTITEFDISPDNILSIGTKDGRILFMGAETLEIFDTYFLSSGVSTIDWSINSSRFAAGLEDGTIIVWDDDVEVLNVSFAEEWINGVSISPDGNTIAICYESFGLLVLNVSDPYTFLLHIPDEATDCAFSPFKDLAVAYSEGQVVVYNIETQATYSLGEIDDANNIVGWSSDGSRLFASGGTQALKIWSMPDGTLVQDQTFKRSYVSHMVVGDGKVVVATYRYVYLYNLNGKSIFDFPPKPEAPLLLPISIIGAVALIILIIMSELSIVKDINS